MGTVYDERFAHRYGYWRLVLSPIANPVCGLRVLVLSQPRVFHGW